MNNSSSSTESVNVLNLWLWKTNCLRSQSESEIVANIRLARLKIIHVYHHLLIIIDKTLYVHLRVSISRLAISSIKNIPFSSPYPRYAHRNAHDIYIYISRRTGVKRYHHGALSISRLSTAPQPIPFPPSGLKAWLCRLTWPR